MLTATLNWFTSSLLISDPENGIRQPVAEGIIVLELLEELRVVGEKRGDDALERFVVLNAGVLL
jgi:hypothetical protein